MLKAEVWVDGRRVRIFKYADLVDSFFVAIHYSYTHKGFVLNSSEPENTVRALIINSSTKRELGTMQFKDANMELAKFRANAERAGFRVWNKDIRL